MARIKLSVVIPDYKDPLLVNTIDSILSGSKLGESLEIIAVLDGYWPWFELRNDPRVRYIHLGKNRGMRDAINAGVSIAKGEFIMRSDEHCMFAPGFDKAMTDVCEKNWIMTARRYYLDPVKWEVMQEKGYVDYEKLKIRDLGDGVKKFEGVVWHKRAKERKDIMVDETMSMQGSCWVMPRRWWKRVIKRLDSKNYGTMYQDSHEMVFKTWEKGGKLMVNKNTWFAHKHVSFPRTHQYSRRNWEHGVKYAYETWKDCYEKEIRKKWGI